MRIIGVPKERSFGERRVALTTDACTTPVKDGFEILVEEGAVTEAFFADDNYRHAGAEGRFNMGLVIMTGISIGTLFTLFVVPAMYMMPAVDHARSLSTNLGK